MRLFYVFFLYFNWRNEYHERCCGNFLPTLSIVSLYIIFISVKRWNVLHYYKFYIFKIQIPLMHLLINVQPSLHCWFVDIFFRKVYSLLWIEALKNDFSKIEFLRVNAVLGPWLYVYFFPLIGYLGINILNCLILC